MRTLKILSPLVGIILLMGISDCDKEDPQPKTKLPRSASSYQPGVVAFGGLINGLPFGFDQLETTAILHDGLSIDANNEFGRIYFFINDANVQDVVYYMNSGSAHFGDVQSLFYNCQGYTTKVDGNLGIITITNFDQVHSRVSGTFKFSLKLPGCSSIEIADGFFEVNYTH